MDYNANAKVTYPSRTHLQGEEQEELLAYLAYHALRLSI